MHPMQDNSKERGLRVVFADRTATCEELLKKASLQVLQTEFQDILILMHKVKHSLAPLHICNQDKRNLRSDFPIPPYGTLKYGKHSIRYISPHL